MVLLSGPNINGNEWKYVKDCLDTGWVSSVGSYVTDFEKKIVKVYPNPAIDEIHFDIENNSRQPQTILLRDVSGRMIYEALFTENEVVVNSTEIPNGMYLYTILFTDKKPLQGKIIIQH